MLAIRMRRLGAKRSPFFRVVVIDSHAARDGRSLEVLGHYNPTSQPEGFKIKRDRLEHWLLRGARPSDTVRALLRRHPAEDAAPSPSPPDVAAASSAPPPAAPTAQPEPSEVPGEGDGA